jgi:hypothetical protein
VPPLPPNKRDNDGRRSGVQAQRLGEAVHATAVVAVHAPHGLVPGAALDDEPSTGGTDESLASCDADDDEPAFFGGQQHFSSPINCSSQ